MDNKITININVGPEGTTVEEDIPEILKKRTKNGKKSVLKMPFSEGGNTINSPILDMMGI